MRTPSKYELTRVNFNLPSKLVEKLKDYSEEMGMPMTQIVTMLLNQALESKLVFEQLPKVTKMYDDYKQEQYFNKDNDSLI